MAPKCPLFNKADVLCRIKQQSQHRWVANEQTWYLSNYCASDYYIDCVDYEAYLEQQAITKGKILVIDDEAEFLEALNSFFSLRGYQTVTASSAEKALRIIAQDEPALATRRGLKDVLGLQRLRRVVITEVAEQHVGVEVGQRLVSHDAPRGRGAGQE